MTLKFDPCNDLAKPSVLIDARMITSQGHGISTYVINLACGLKKLNPLKFNFYFLIDSKNCHPDFLSQFYSNCIPCDIPFLSIKELFFLPFKIKQINPNIYHSPSFSSFLNIFNLTGKIKKIITIHDLIHLESDFNLKPTLKNKLYYNLVLKPYAKKADLILSVSNASSQKIKSWLQLEPKAVVYNAINQNFHFPKISFSSVKTKTGLHPQSYFLCVSNRKPHKNVETLKRAYSEYLKQNPSQPMPLIILHEHPEWKLTDAEYKSLIQNAKAVFFPSLVEGFGLPPLEAFAGGTPTFLSTIPAHQEAFARFSSPSPLQGVNWVEPALESEWTKAFRLAESPELKKPLSQDQVALTELYSQKNLAQHMDQIYQSMLE